MTTSATRPRGLSRALAAIVGVVLAATTLVVAASPAAAASTADYTGLGPSATVKGRVGGRDKSATAGIMKMRIDGRDTLGYCIDIHTAIDTRSGRGLVEQGWDESTIANLAQVEQILANYYPNGDGPGGYRLVGNDDRKAAGVQAAIWHFTDGFELNTKTGNHADVVKNYETILRAVADGALQGFGEPAPSLSIDPPAATEGPVGGLVGPFVVTSTAPSVALRPGAGTTLHDADGQPLGGTVPAGTEVYMKRTDPGEGSFTATAEAAVRRGRVFHKKGVQRLILATEADASVTASASAAFVDRGTATVRKETLGRGGTFTFVLTGPGLAEGGVEASVDTSGQASFDAALTPGGRYTIREVADQGWVQTPVTCTVPHEIDGAAVTFTVPQGNAAVVCDFANTALYDLVVTKEVAGDDDLWGEAGFDPAEAAFRVGATCTGEDADDLVFDPVELRAGESVRFGPIPHGHACTVTEDVSAVGLADGFAWATPQVTPDVEVLDGDGDEVVVTNEIVREGEAPTTTVPGDDESPTTTAPDADKPKGGLPLTGANSLLLAAIAAVLVLGGGGLVLAARKRRSA